MNGKDDHVSCDLQQQQQNGAPGYESLGGAEHFLLGVSPQYWSHAPLSVRSLNQLGLVEGIDCLVVERHHNRVDQPHTLDPIDQEAQDNGVLRKRKRQHNVIFGETMDDKEMRFIPVSKCELQGVIVNAERRSNGSCLYLLDDGTGLVDCLAWVDNAIYSLPPLVPHDQSCSKGLFRVGDIVQVYGKIRCVSIGSVRRAVKMHGRTWEIRDCVREVHVTNIASLREVGDKRCTSMNLESNHWLRCIQFIQRASIGIAAETGAHHTGKEEPCATIQEVSSDQSHYLDLKRSMTEPIRNGADVLSLLGSEITSKALQRADFPATDDAYGAWRVFGVGCQCDLPYQEALLYCHCQATVEPLDPHFKFRDALLTALIKLESEVDLSAGGHQPKRCLEDRQLRFQYKSIIGDDALQAIAAQIVLQNNNASINVDRLFIKTFAALRKDGIISLLDDETDTYLLVSRNHVIEPYCDKILAKMNSSSLEQRILQSERPTYLRNVPSARLQYVKKIKMDKCS